LTWNISKLTNQLNIMVNLFKNIVLTGCATTLALGGLVGSAIADDTRVSKASVDATVRQTYETWVSTVGAAKCNPVPVLALYDKEAILLATLSSGINLRRDKLYSGLCGHFRF
jgi:hypothetical protein